MMFKIALFEFKSRLKLISTWVYFFVFFALAMLWMAAAGGLFKEANVSFGSGKVFVNSAFAVAQTVGFLGMFGVTVMSAIMGRAVQQDFEYRMQSFFFTTPITKAQYLGGRFMGAFAVVAFVFLSIVLGAFLGTLLPGMDAERMGPNRLAAYVMPFFTVLLPNILLIGGVFFSLAALTRKMLPVYVGSVLVLIGSLAATSLLRDMDNKTIAALIDPFGTRAISILTEYWTIAERNTKLINLEGVFLQNRLLWLAVALVLMAVCYFRFSFAQFGQEAVSKQAKKKASAIQEPAFDAAAASAPRIATEPSAIKPWALLPGLVKMYFVETVKNIYFGVIVLAGLLFMIVSSTTSGDIFGTSTWPVTYQMTALLGGSFALFMLIIITFYSGEMVWREREHRLDQIIDATPMPTWLPFVAKLFALMLLPVLLSVLLMLTGMGIQASKSYFSFEIGQYFKTLFGISLVEYWFTCALALTVHSVINNKYLGHFVMIVYFVLLTFAGQMGLEHNLYKFGMTPSWEYSDMNGYGHFMGRLRMFHAYWFAASVLLSVGAYLLWTRGTVAGWRERLSVLRSRLSGPTLAVGGTSALAFAALGGVIFYNTNVLNTYDNSFSQQTRQADYEKRYKPLDKALQPKITAVKLDVDIFPSEQRVRVRGNYELVNKNAEAVTTLNLNLASGRVMTIHKLELSLPAQIVEDKIKDNGMRRYQLSTPMAPQEKATLSFDLELPTKGFTNEGSNTMVVSNGSFINGQALLPLIGYQEAAEMQRDQDRKKFGLAPKERMLDRDDAEGLKVNGLSSSADWINFETTVSTEADQTAISPGYLQKEWTDKDRRYFTYKMDVPIANFFAFQSARYAVKKAQWKSASGEVTPIEVYYHPTHTYNIDTMIDATKASLTYFSEKFGPYQYRQFRIIEFPRYETFAQSFPNTIPYSEGIGFIARVRPDDEKDIDYPYYVTAHEVAHQWWGHQVISGNTQGGTMLVESFAQYSALMMMKHKYGEVKMRRFLAYELDRYLQGRAFEQKKELPLSRVENQGYIHYRKGSLIMYALQDYLGEDKVNSVLKRFRDEHAFKGPPYPNSTAFLKMLSEVTPPELQYLIDDMFEKIVIYDNRAITAKAKKLADGRYEVSMKVFVKKRQSDDLGKETDMPLNDLIDVGVVDEKGDAISVEKKRITQEETEFTMVVNKKPAKAGVDPLNKLIDRRPKDNAIRVEGL
jgi:ABC-2 type transport system permease protein